MLDATIGAGAVDTLREANGLTDSPVVRYARWGSVARGDFGMSLAHRAPVAPLLWERTRNTLILTVPALLITCLIALPVGLWTARNRGRMLDRLCVGATSVFLALPDLLIGLLMLLVALKTGLFPTGGMFSPGGRCTKAGCTRRRRFGRGASVPSPTSWDCSAERPVLESREHQGQGAANAAHGRAYVRHLRDESAPRSEGPEHGYAPAVVKKHPEYGWAVLRAVPGFECVSPFVLHHHEAYDGKGYPAGLRGDEISIGSRIVSVMDASDAMVSSRPYRKGLPLDEAIRRLEADTGRQFDPIVTPKFIALARSGAAEVFDATGASLASAL